MAELLVIFCLYSGLQKHSCLAGRVDELASAKCKFRCYRRELLSAAQDLYFPSGRGSCLRVKLDIL